MSRIDIVITDLNLPRIDGIEFIREIGKLSRPVSIVLVSAVEPAVLAAVGNEVNAYGTALLGVLQKPLTADALLVALEHYSPGAQATKAPLRLTSSAPDIARGLIAEEFVSYLKVDQLFVRAFGAQFITAQVNVTEPWPPAGTDPVNDH
jgi:DNA-binding response OmpR family regulator